MVVVVPVAGPVAGADFGGDGGCLDGVGVGGVAVAVCF